MDSVTLCSIYQRYKLKAIHNVLTLLSNYLLTVAKFQTCLSVGSSGRNRNCKKFIILN